jgi:hypothetical protein
VSEVNRRTGHTSGEGELMILSDEERRRLDELADRLIPAEDGMPAGSTGRIDEVLESRPDLVPELRRILAGGGEPTPEETAFVGEIVAGAYFLHEKVQDLVYYHGRRALPIPATPDYGDLISPVAERGPIYRPTP